MVSVRGPHDLRNFDPEMKNRPIFTQTRDATLRNEGEDYFPDFTYANPNIL